MPRSSARQKRTRKSCDNGLIHAGLLTSGQLESQFRALGNPQRFIQLQKDSNTRRFANVRAVNVALGEEEGEGVLRLVDDTNEGTGFVSENANSANGVPVKIVPLDALAKGVEGKIDLIKIDVEGFERQVLRGATQTLAEHQPIVTFEYYVNQQGESNVFELLESSGYHQFYYVGTKFDNKTNGLWGKVAHFLLDTLTNSSFRVMPVKGRGRDYNMVIAVPDCLQEHL